MLLALRSGIDSEVGWALDRLCRLCNNEQFLLNAIPGLTDTLFEWPEWFIEEHRQLAIDASEGWEGGSRRTRVAGLFALSRERQRKKRHALESLFVLRNSALNEPNARELAAHRKTEQLVLDALRYLAPSVLGRPLEDSEEPSLDELVLEGNWRGTGANWDDDPDSTEEFLLHSIELLQAISPSFILPPPSHFDFSAITSSSQNPVPTLANIASMSSNRALIIASLTTLNTLLSNIANATHLSASSPALTAAIRYLPLFNDKPLLDACLNYLYAHISHPPMANAFLLHADMPSTLRLLISFIISEQAEETKTIDISASKHFAPSIRYRSVDYELMGEELERIGSMPEPERCYQWYEMASLVYPLCITNQDCHRMRVMFIAQTDAELTQVEFWSSYKDLFTPYQDRSPLLAASDVIKNVSSVFGLAQAMVLPGPQQRFVIRGITHQKALVPEERFKCLWDRGSCPSQALDGPEALYAHIQTHLDSDIPSASDGAQAWACSWSSCYRSAPSKDSLLPHIWTHVPLRHNPFPVPYPHYVPLPQIILADSDATDEPDADILAYPTRRPPPPALSTTISFPVAAQDKEPSSSALTALLIVRTLFRASYASADAAPRADAEHFGFPGLPDEGEEADVGERDGEERYEGEGEKEAEGERRGRRAFMYLRKLMEGVRIRDQALMSWVLEMVDTGLNGTH